MGLDCSKFRPDPKPVKVEKKKIYKIKPLSDKRAVQNKAYLTLRKVYLENHKECQINGVGCTKKAVEIHHDKGRVGKLLTDVNFFVAICRSCHNQVENNNTNFYEAPGR